MSSQRRGSRDYDDPRFQISDPTGHPDEEVIRSLRYLARETELLREELRFEIGGLRDDFQKFQLDFVRLQTEVHTAARVGWAMLGVLVVIALGVFTQ